jgi:putative tricarboxylic transport membrane protein
MVKRIVDMLFTAMVFIGTVYLWLVADKFPTFAKYRNVDSAFWPKIVLVSMGILSVLILYENIVALRIQRSKKQVVASAGERDAAAAAVSWKRMIFMGVLCVAYYWGLSLMGFVLSTIVFMWLAMVIIGGAKKITAIVFPIVFTGLLVAVFVKVLELSLPRGIGIFHELSLLLY